MEKDTIDIRISSNIFIRNASLKLLQTTYNEQSPDLIKFVKIHFRTSSGLYIRNASKTHKTVHYSFFKLPQTTFR